MKKLCFIVLLLLVGCTSDDEIGGFYIDTQSTYHLMNTNDEDLLDSTVENSFLKSKIRVEHQNSNGNFIEFYQSNLDSYYDYFIYELNGYNSFVLLNQVSDDFINNNKIVSVIKWNSSEQDTIITQVYRTDRLTLKKKVWVNGELKYDVDNGIVPDVITIKKNHL